jgi:hypothetical protein
LNDNFGHTFSSSVNSLKTDKQVFPFLPSQQFLMRQLLLVAQDYFKELTDQDVRKRLYEEQKNQCCYKNLFHRLIPPSHE